MNITKEYIDLCKNDKVQGLRKELKVGDWFFDLDAEEFEKKINIMTNDIDDINFGDNFIWLPRSDQLDQCIVDICKRHNLDYQVGTTKKPNYWWWITTTSRVGDPDENIVMVEAEENPLIAKLKLLLTLLESEE